MGAVLDIDQLKLMTSEDPELAMEALGIFRSQAELWSRLLEPGAETTHWTDACHAIKGAARSIGAMQLGDACATAEELGREGEMTQVQTSVALSDVKDKLGAALEAIAETEHRLNMAKGFPATA